MNGNDLSLELGDRTSLPLFLYGTAWKEAETERLTSEAIQLGFRGIDTANQRRHYHEAAVGKALTGAIQKDLVKREELFVQTKFTFLGGQDHRLPYDPKATIAKQVEQSFASSLEHLGCESIDSYVLHGPSTRIGLGANDWEAWKAMEAIHDTGRIRYLGVSNFTLEQLEMLVANSRIPPQFVQNRCYASRGWDRQVREYCKAKHLIYQGFSLLTANKGVVNHPAVLKLAKSHGRSPAQIVFRFALDIGMLPLTGTTSLSHMKEALEVSDFHLRKDEIEQIERLVQS